MVSTGGTSVKEDIYRLYQVVHVIVCTPGRILDLASKQVADLSKCEIIVMDEADKLLSVDFQPIIEKILEFIPKNHQILMLSATFPTEVESFTKRYLSNAKQINLMEELTLKGLTQYYAYVEEKQKVHCLNTLLVKLQINQTMIFCTLSSTFELRRSLSIAVDRRPGRAAVSVGQYILIEGDDDDNPFVAQLLKLFCDGNRPLLLLLCFYPSPSL